MAFSKQDALDYLTRRGLSPVAAAGLVGNMGAESGYDPGVEEKSGGGGYGLMQWTGPRRAGLVQWAADHGSSVDDPRTQMDFMLHEINTTERKAGDMLTSATTADEANKAALAFLRPAGWSPGGDVTKASQYDTRLENTRSLLNEAPPPPPPAPYTPAPPPDAAVASAPATQPQQPYGSSLNKVGKLAGLLGSLAAPTFKPMAATPMVPPPPMPQNDARMPQAQPLMPTMPQPTRNSVEELRQRLAQMGGLFGGWPT